jgi:hypothetical protein
LFALGAFAVKKQLRFSGFSLIFRSLFQEVIPPEAHPSGAYRAWDDNCEGGPTSFVLGDSIFLSRSVVFREPQRITFDIWNQKLHRKNGDSKTHHLPIEEQ